MPEDSEPSGPSLVEALARLADERIGGADAFGTWTFRDPPARPGSPLYTQVGHAGARRAMTKYLVGLADVYPNLGAFVAMEPHAFRSSPHFHGLLSVGDEVARAIDSGRRGLALPAGASFEARHARDLFWQSWFDGHGMARLERVDGDGAALYTSKYAMKAGDRIPWWVIYEPGELRELWVRQDGRKVRRA